MSLFGDLQSLMDCKDGHIQDLAEEMEELWRLLREAVQENDDLQCALENCKQSLESHLDSSNAVQMHVTELQRLMDSFRKQSCVPIKMQPTMTPRGHTGQSRNSYWPSNQRLHRSNYSSYC